MELNFSKKTRKIVASLLAVAILLGVLPVSGLTGNSSGEQQFRKFNKDYLCQFNKTAYTV